jgi:hypothetical protein
MVDNTDSLINWDDDENAAAPEATSTPEETTDGGAFSSGEVVVANDESPAFAGDSEHITIIQVDHNGNEISATIDLTLPPLTVEQATEITERIKTTTNVLYLLIKRAHAGKAYTALGYTTFEEYVKAEFNYSRSYAYKLLNQANVIEAIEQAAPEGTSFYVGDAAARSLKRVLPEIIEEVQERTSGYAPTDAGAVIEDIIREHREKERDRLSDDDDDNEDEPRKYDGPYTGDYDGGYDDDDDDEDDDVSGFLDEDPAVQRRKFDKLYSLYAGLKGIDSVGDGSELPSFVPEERRGEFNTLIESVTDWLIEFRELWHSHEAEKDSENAVTDADADINADADDDFEE